MKKWVFLLFALVCALPFRAQEKCCAKGHTLLLTGASFASPENGWFELGCEQLNAVPLNRAVGGEAIANTANKMLEGKLYSPEELEKIDALVIMQVHDKDVFDQSQLHEKYTDYSTPFDRSNYAAAYDYVIKRYLTDCYNLQFDKQSKYYGVKTGKPAVVILCTHWNDARTVYNTSVRKLAAKWGFPLVEFDRYIGFSKEVPHPVTGTQTSLLYAQDSTKIDGVTHGWHPMRGKDQYIQQKMATIFVDVMRKILVQPQPCPERK